LEDEAKEFEKDAAKIKDCFNARFLTVKKGTSPVQMPHVLYPDSIFYGNNTVTANILPLAFDMVPEAYREEVEKNVITGIITRNKGHISSRRHWWRFFFLSSWATYLFRTRYSK
jgi:alpha-L-rhamnosidase